MKLAGIRTIAALGIGLAAVPVAWGEESPAENENPYKIIAERNAFGIKPQEPPPPVVPPAPPPPPPSNVFLTGISDFGDGRQAYFSINKPGAKAPEFLAMKEGESQGDIQVVAIDMKAETVRIRNAGNEVSLNFKDNGLKPTAGAPGVPGVPPPPGGVPGVTPTAPGVPSPVPQPGRGGTVGAAGGGGPIIVGRRGEVQTGGAAANVAAAQPSDFAAPVTINPGATAPLRELPIRRTRTDMAAPAIGETVQQGGTPEGIKIVPPPTFRPPLPGQPGQ